MVNSKIAVIGLGYVGLSNGLLLSQHNEVVALDIIPEKVEMLNDRKSPIEDREIEEYFQRDELSFRVTLDKVDIAKCFDFVNIDTSTDYDIEINDYNVKSIGIVIRYVISSNLNKSIIPVGYTKSIEVQ